MCSIGVEKGCIRFLDRSNQNSGFHGNRTYDGENVVFIFDRIFIKLADNQDTHKITELGTIRYGVTRPSATKDFLIDL